MTKSTKQITLVLSILLLAIISHSSIAAKNSNKQAKMQEKIQAQQDTIDLLTLMLEKNSTGNSHHSMKPSGGETMIMEQAPYPQSTEVNTSNIYRPMPKYELSFP